IYRPPEARTRINLNTLDARFYSMQQYPPDFFVFDTSGRRVSFFVEVKGRHDALRFNQATWLVHLLPSSYYFEICAIADNSYNSIYFLSKHGSLSTLVFDEEYRRHLEGVRSRIAFQGASYNAWERYYETPGPLAETLGRAFWEKHAPWRLGKQP